MCEPPEIKAADLHDGHDKERVNRAKLPRSPRLPVAVGQTGADHGVILTSPRKQNIADPSLPSDVEVFHLLSDGTRQHCAIVLLLLSKMAPMRVLRYLRYNSDRCRIKWKLLTTKTISYSVSFFFFYSKRILNEDQNKTNNNTNTNNNKQTRKGKKNAEKTQTNSYIRLMRTFSGNPSFEATKRQKIHKQIRRGIKFDLDLLSF